MSPIKGDFRDWNKTAYYTVSPNKRPRVGQVLPYIFDAFEYKINKLDICKLLLYAFKTKVLR